MNNIWFTATQSIGLNTSHDFHLYFYSQQADSRMAAITSFFLLKQNGNPVFINMLNVWVLNETTHLKVLLPTANRNMLS